MRKDRASKLVKKKRKGLFIAIGIIVAIAVVISLLVYNYIQNPPRSLGFGALGSAHEHAALKFFINNEEPIDFSLPSYQTKSMLIHFEDDYGLIVHRHATGVDLGSLFESIDMKFDDQCITLDNGTSYCNNADKTLKFFVNKVSNDIYDNYVLNDGDKILITYGNETEEQIESQFNILNLVDIPTGQL